MISLTDKQRATLLMTNGTRRIDFRYELLDRNDTIIRPLTNVESASVSFNAFNTIKRIASFTIRERATEPINFLSDRIKIYMRVWINNYWDEFPLGVFILSSPKRTESGTNVIRDVEAYDSTVILVEDKFTSRYTIRKGTRYIDAVVTILKNSGIRKYNIEQTSKRLVHDLEYEPGTSKIEPIQDLLNAINYTPIYVDENGFFVSRPYEEPSQRKTTHYYQENEFSIIANGIEEELDLYSIPNKWVVIYTNVDGENETSLSAEYTNISKTSPTSTVNRGRTIVDFRRIDEIADQSSLDGYVKRIASEASQVFGKVKFQTAIMPNHGYSDIILLENKTLGIASKYTETAWKITCKPGTLMEHEARKVVVI